MAIVEQRSPDLVRFLRTRGTEVFLGETRTLDDVLALVEAIGARVGKGAAARQLASRLRARIAEVPRPSRPPLPVFVYDCCDPAFTAGGRAVLSDLVARAGGQNVFADLDAAWTKVPWESVVSRKPALIIINDYDFSGQGDAGEKRARLGAIPSLAKVPTTVMPLGEAIGGIRSIEGLVRLASAIARAG
jgi:iron complex transport system substrate-binding protein